MDCFFVQLCSQLFKLFYIVYCNWQLAKKLVLSVMKHIMKLFSNVRYNKCPVLL